MNKRTVLYSTQSYPSFVRARSAYIDALRSEYVVTTDLTHCCDVAILHSQPTFHQRVLQNYSRLKCGYIISYCVWEASHLPTSYKQALDGIDEVWTPSEYCRAVISKYHPNVITIPHAVDRDTTVTDVDRSEIKQLIEYNERFYYFLAIGRTLIKRKNLSGLVNVFIRIARSMPRARMIIKCAPGEGFPHLQHPHVLYVPTDLTQGQMNALYECSNAYVSAHHSEGWGFCLSDAMLFCLPVAATGYSGNLEFMNSGNSLLLQYTVGNILSSDCYGAFTPDMSWAYVDEADLGGAFQYLYENRYSDSINQKVRRARSDIENFTASRVGSLALKRLKAILLD